MKTRLFVLALLLGSCVLGRASVVLGPWTPLFKGIDHAVGTNVPDGSTPITVLQVMHAARVDLWDPDVQLMTDPRADNYAENTRETVSLSVGSFLRRNGVQLAVDANFYGPNSDPSSENLAMDVHGLLISKGTVVSRQQTTTETSVLMFTTNKEPIFVFDNQPPGSNTTGIYTAVCGHYPLIISGESVANDAASPIPGHEPRTAYGVSADQRYLYLITIDGRQPGYSDGALDSETVYWLFLLGVENAINMDGGGSTTLDMADCSGNPVGLNHSSYIASRGRERYIGAHFGVYAKPLSSFIGNLVVAPYDSTATITCQTPVPAAMQIDYGTTANYGSSVGNPALLKNHVATLNGLNPSTPYYFRITCTAGADVSRYACQFVTTNFASTLNTLVFDVTNKWKYATNNLDGVNWQAKTYDDAPWFGPSNALFYIESGPTAGPKSTGLPPTGGPQTGAAVFPTYYFRAHFNFNTNIPGVTLNFTNYVDDGAVFYVNGIEVYRLRMPAAPALINYLTQATGSPCGGDATCADVFSLSRPALRPLVSGDNVLAVEVHQNSAIVPSPDIVFGTALSYTQAGGPKPLLNILREETTTTVYWNGGGFTLQQADNPFGPWTDVPGPVRTSTFVIATSAAAKFYTLRR